MKSTSSLPRFQWKAFLTTGLLVLGILCAYLFLPLSPDMSSAMQSILFGLVFLVLVPTAYVMLVLKKPLSSVGYTCTVRRHGFPVAFISVITVLSIWFLLLRSYDAGTLYSLPYFVQSSFFWFLFYEIVLVGLVAFVYEAFFRGLVMLSWFSSFGVLAVFLQLGVFLLFIGLTGGIGWQNVPTILSGLSAGFVAYYTRSIWYSWAAAWSVMLFADVLFLIFG